jgi:hypothetical protein
MDDRVKVTDAASDEAAQVREGWAYRLIEALRGNQTLMGAMVIAIAGRAPHHPPRILTGAVVSVDGYLMVNFEGRGKPGEALPSVIGQVEAVRDEFRKVCDKIGLPDEERIKFFDEFRKWIVKDWRILDLAQ